MMNLSPREKKLLLVFAIFLSLIIGYYFILTPAMTIIQSSKNEYEKNKNSLLKLNKIYNNYSTTKHKKNRYNSMLKIKGGESTFLSTLSKKYNLLDNQTVLRTSNTFIRNKYSKKIIPLKFEGIYLKPLFKFIQEVEKSNRLIKVSTFILRSAVKNRNTYDANITFEFYSFK